jgi:hypothetical protein
VALGISRGAYYGGDTRPAEHFHHSDEAQTRLGSAGVLVYYVQNYYIYGALRQSQHVGANFLDVDYDLDANSGCR